MLAISLRLFLKIICNIDHVRGCALVVVECMLDKVLFHSLLEALFLIDKLVLCNSELISSDRMLVPQDDGHSKEK